MMRCPPLASDRISGNDLKAVCGQKQIADLHRDVRCVDHGDADLGSGERGRIIDAVAKHAHDLACSAELFDAEALFQRRAARAIGGEATGLLDMLYSGLGIA